MTDQRPPIYTDQDGVQWRTEYARCPMCGHATDWTNRVHPSGYFRCKCGAMYDEPTFDNAEAAYAGTLDTWQV
ncbi:hypothetical protein SEA_SKYSAND_95 [Gordonia phage Skysand]|uniref:Uncharacterized protein n=1 Tax=Gordonia phage Skysand TaxID=2301559 RepID=A0A385DTI6_9CAUD|nr:hypothetical protein KNU08_gp95 [Gordonia phage Skysand]AXQ62128.1 hypothetical protein SEA_SKYSAND_95 [Gordonia phage Skysand]